MDGSLLLGLLTLISPSNYYLLDRIRLARGTDLALCDYFVLVEYAELLEAVCTYDAERGKIEYIVLEEKMNSLEEQLLSDHSVNVET